MTATATPFDQKKLRAAFGHCPSGVAAIAAVHAGERHVLVASSFTVGVSLEPPLAAFFVQKSSFTWSLLAQAQRLGVSVLSTEHADVCRQLAGPDKAARFDGIAHRITPNGAIKLQDSAVWFDCTMHDVHAAGDHLAVQLLIHDLQVQQDAAPLVFHGSRFTRPAHCEAEALCA